MPKVHKFEITKNVINTEDFEYIQVHCSDDLKGRPISGGPEKQTQKVSNLIEILLKTLVTTLKTYMKDDCNSLRKLPSNISLDSSMYSFDISSLYTSIPTKLWIEAIRYWLHKKRELIPQRFTNYFIIKSLKFLLKNNKVLFDDHRYIQLIETAMGTKCAPLSNCWLLRKDKTFYQRTPKILQWKWMLVNYEIIKMLYG